MISLCRWFSSWFLHVSFQHVLANMLLFAAVAYQVEEKYGCLRVGLLWFVSAMGGVRPIAGSLLGAPLLLVSHGLQDAQKVPCFYETVLRMMQPVRCQLSTI